MEISFMMINENGEMRISKIIVFVKLRGDD
jgi:hypothetical protein